MNFERDQAVDAVVLMFWMSCRGVGKPVFPKVSRPHRNDATRMSMSLQQVERAELQRPVEEKLDVVHVQYPLAGKDRPRGPSTFRPLEMPSRARHGKQFTTEGRADVEDRRLPSRGKLPEADCSFQIGADRSAEPTCCSCPRCLRRRDPISRSSLSPPAPSTPQSGQCLHPVRLHSAERSADPAGVRAAGSVSSPSRLSA